MRMNTHERPINLDLTQFSFPLPALASITHRITGVILFEDLLFALYALTYPSPAPRLAEAKALLAAPLGKFIAWAPCQPRLSLRGRAQAPLPGLGYCDTWPVPSLGPAS